MADSEAKSRILLVSAVPPAIGGISRWTQGILESNLANEFDIEIFDTSPPEVESVSGGSRFRFRRALMSLAMLFRFSTSLMGRRVRLVHINTSYYWAFPRDGLMVWISSFLGARTVLHLHGGDFDLFARGCRGPFRWFIERTLQRADAIVSITRTTQEFLCQNLEAEKVFYLPNFVRSGQLAPRTQDAGTREGDKRARSVEVLFVGWIIEAKGVIELLNVARRVSGAHFTLVGPVEPDFLPRIESLIEELGDAVTLLEPLPHEDILDLYARSDVFVLPTHREGFPNVIIEAMAAGLPVITTPVGAIPEIIRDEVDGFLIPVGDVAALEDRLVHLTGNADRRIEMGESGRSRVREHFDLGIVVRELSRLYRALIPSHVSNT